MAATARQTSIQPELFGAAIPSADPAALEALLTSGGDARIVLDEVTGVNRYGCGPRPDPGTAPFGSSTASTLSTASFAAVERLAERLLTAPARDTPGDLYRRELNRVRAKLAGLLGLQDIAGLKTILSASGTDLHRVALHLTVAGVATPPLVILPEPHETGSGVVSALGGQLGAAAALRATWTAANPASATLPPQIMTAPSRAANGALRPVHQIDEDIAAIVASAARLGRKVLLVMMDVSKTGLITPSVACAQDLKQRFPEQVEVLVDACQLRLAGPTLAAYLRQDFMVAVTGSKFMTGPAFSAALLIPTGAAERLQSAPLPRSFAALCARGELPEEWRGAPELHDHANFGLLARWEAALEEMGRFTALPPSAVAGFFADFAEAVSERLTDHDCFEAVAVRPLERTGLGALSSWDRVQTIFPFLLKTKGRPMTPLETVGVQRLAGLDLGEWAGWDAAARRAQLGQPVHCGRRAGQDLSALRLCMSARIATEALAPGGHGPATVIDDALEVLDKTAWLTTRITDA